MLIQSGQEAEIKDISGHVPKRKFLNYMHYFRGIAVVGMVIVHIWMVPQQYENWGGAKFINISRETLFHDTSLFFVFISGFLFYYLSTGFKTIKYYKSKLSHVISPYVFLTIGVFLVNCFLFDDYHQLSRYGVLREFFVNLLYGCIQVQFWYIPFISLVFLISPLLLKIPKDKFQIVVLVGLFLPLLGTRSGIFVSIGQYIYFLPVYLLGMYAAMNHSKFVALIKDNTFLISAISIITTAAITFFQYRFYHSGWEPEALYPIPMISIWRSISLRFDFLESLYYLQKISLCFLLIIFLMRFEDKKSALLDKFATYSFSIYFMHGFIGNGFVLMSYYNLASAVPMLLVPLSILYITIVIFSTLLVCVLLKKAIGAHSRYFIGV